VRLFLGALLRNPSEDGGLFEFLLVLFSFASNSATRAVNAATSFFSMRFSSSSRIICFSSAAIFLSFSSIPLFCHIPDGFSRVLSYFL